MILSMTGYGRWEITEGQITAVAEIRSVNSRYFEVSSKLPRTMSLRENEVKELLRAKFTRGKINVVLSITRENTNGVSLKINKTAVKSFYKLLNDLRKEVKIQEKVKLEHLLNFPEVIEVNEFEQCDEREWLIAKKVLNKALDEVILMRLHEGSELLKDLLQRIKQIDEMIDQIETISRDRLPEERKRLEERVKELVNNQLVIDNNRLELEFALMIDKLDITEECVRFRSHNKFFVESLYSEEATGRKLNFLTQEMNREANTIGAKANNAKIAHLVIVIKEELEKIREQLQNIE